MFPLWLVGAFPALPTFSKPNLFKGFKPLKFTPSKPYTDSKNEHNLNNK